MRALLLLLAACGRIGFDEPGEGDRDAGDVGSTCLVDEHCGLCQRCNASNVCEAEPIDQLFVGHRLTCFLGAGGSRWCVGEEDGFSRGTATRRPIRRIPGEDGWTTLGLGWLTHLGVRNGQTYKWNDTSNEVVDPTGTWDQIANDMDSGCFIRGSTLTCGGQIVDGAWRSLAGGANHRCGLQTDGSIWCWGLEDGNVLGQGVQPSGSTLDVPTRVGTDNDWIDVGTGARLSCGMKADRSIWCWGDPQLTGTNTVDSLGVPLRIPGDNWAWLEVAWNRACAGTADKHLWCWGSDGYGLEVVPGIDPVLVPTDLGGTFDEVLLGGHHTCARIGSAWSCWGWNAGGQLVNGNVETHQYPGVPLCGR